MKKFFSLLCATLLVFSASAAPVAKKAELVKKAPVAVEQMQKVQFEEAQSVKTLSLENVQLSDLNRLSAAPALTVSNQKAQAQAQVVRSSQMLKKAQAPAHRTAPSAKKAAKAPLNTAITIGTFSPATYEGEYYVVLTDANSTTQFYFDFDTSVNPFEVGKTYTLDEMLADFVAMGDADDWYVWEPATAATYTETVDEKGLTHIVASMTTESGTYDITYDQLPSQSKTIVASDFSMEDYGTDMFFILTDSVGNQFRFDVLYTGSFEFDKTYTLADMDPDYSWYKLATGGGLTYIEASFTITEDQDELLHVVAAAVLSNGESYEITYDEKAFEPTGKQIEVNGTDLNGQYLSAYGFYLYTATWGDYTVQLAFDAEEEKAAYTNEEFIANYGLIYTNSEKIPLLKLASDNITITTTETTKTLAGSVYAKNGDEYVLNLVYEKPAVETATAIVEDAKLTKTSQFFHVDGNDTKGEYGITLYVVTKNLEGEFTVEDLDVYSSGVTDLSAKKWFDIDSCNIVSEKLGSNTLVISGLLHTSNEQLGRFIDLTFIMTARVDANGELMNIYGIITQPANGTTKEYNRLATNTCFYNNSGTKLAYQSGTATLVECADGTVYWQNPVSTYTSGAWIKGKKEGSTITFATKQPVSYSSQYNITLSVRWGNFNTQKFAVADDYADSFILDIKGDSLIMRGTQATTGSTATYFPGIFWDDDDSFQGYGDCGVNLYIPGWTPSTELITPPAELVTVKMPFTGSGAQTEYADSVLVGWDNDTVYIQGLAVDFPTAWIKGVLKEGVVTFEKFQFVGKYNGTMPIWVLGTNAESELIDFTMTYDAQANLFKATNIFVVNASYEKIYYLDKVSKIVIGEVAQADWGEWEDFAPFGYNTGSWTFVAMATSPKTYTNYVALVRTDKNNADNKQIKITNWGEGWFGEGVELIINWNAKDNTCSIDKQYTGYTDTQYGKVSISSVEDGTYNPETATFSIHVDYTVSAGSFGNDVETYVMDAKQPGMMYDTDAPFDATFAYSDMSTDLDEGVIGIYATNAEGYTIGLELYADPAATEIPAGTYVISDTQEAGTALQSLGVAGGYLTECYAGTLAASGGIDDCWFLVEGTITLSYDEYGKLKVVVDGTNSWGQPVTALVQYVKLEPKSTVDIVATNLTYTDEWYAQYGIQEFVLTNDNYGVLLDIFADTLVGEFTEDDVDLADSYIVDFNTGAKIPVVNTGDIVVTLDGKNLALTANLVGADTIQYNISATGYLGYIQGDAVEGYVGEFAVEDLTFSQQKAKKLVTLSGTNAKGDMLTIIVQGTTLNNENKLAAGTYEDIQASIGWDEDNQVTPSFVGNNAGIWFIQSGELVVNEDGSMAFLGVNSYDAPVAIGFTVPAPAVTDYYLVGWINNAAYGIEDDIDNFGDYHFVDGKVRATFDVMSYVQVKDNNKQIYGTASYVAPAAEGTSAVVSATGTEKMGIDGNVEFEYTLTIAEDGTLTLSYAPTTVDLRNAKANVKAAKRIDNGQIVIVRDNKEYNILGSAL